MGVVPKGYEYIFFLEQKQIVVRFKLCFSLKCKVYIKMACQLPRKCLENGYCHLHWLIPTILA